MMKVQVPGFKPALRASLAVMVLMTMLLATAVPAGAASSPVSSAIAPVGTPGNALDSAGASGGEKLLQFTSAGHVLGFSRDGVIIASRDHMLKTGFIGSRAVAPVADAAVSAENSAGMASPLSRVTYPDVWDEVTVVYEASPGVIVESIYYINATGEGIPVERIRLGYNRPLSIDEQGNLVIAYETGTMVENAPVAWQEINGQRMPVTVAFALYGEREVGFSLGDYVPGMPVVIDPELTWNTFLGGNQTDYGRAVAVDGSGNVYVAGQSGATWGTPVRAFTANWDAFAARLDSSGGLTWNTFLGGNDNDYGRAIAVDGSGNVYVAGQSGATWGSPVRAYTAPDYDGFAARLDSSGGLTWNTFLGGSGYENGYGIAVDGSGNVYVGGQSGATWGAPWRGYNTANWDAFAARLDSSGGLTWNTFLGGDGSDIGKAIAVDGSGNVYVGGNSDDTWGTPVRAYAGDDAFAAKVTQTPATVTTNAASGVTTNSATLNMSYTVGEFSPVDVRFAYKKAADSTWSYTPWVSKSAAGTHAETVTGLDSGTTYDFRAELRYTTVLQGSTLQFSTGTTPPSGPRASPSPPQLPPADVRLNNISVSPGQAQGRDSR